MIGVKNKAVDRANVRRFWVLELGTEVTPAVAVIGTIPDRSRIKTSLKILITNLGI